MPRATPVLTRFLNPSGTMDGATTNSGLGGGSLGTEGWLFKQLSIVNQGACLPGSLCWLLRKGLFGAPGNCIPGRHLRGEAEARRFCRTLGKNVHPTQQRLSPGATVGALQGERPALQPWPLLEARGLWAHGSHSGGCTEAHACRVAM